jgi:hypothetical protein
MAGVTLAHADIALWSDVAGTRLVIPRLQVLAPAEVLEQAYIRFEGDERKTGFRGEGKDLVLSMTARYLSTEHADAAALVELFRYAHDTDPDGRLQLRTHAGLVAGLNDLEAVMVASFGRPIVRGLNVDVAFTAQAVQYTLAV